MVAVQASKLDDLGGSFHRVKDVGHSWNGFVWFPIRIPQMSLSTYLVYASKCDCGGEIGLFAELVPGRHEPVDTLVLGRWWNRFAGRRGEISQDLAEFDHFGGVAVGVKLSDQRSNEWVFRSSNWTSE